MSWHQLHLKRLFSHGLMVLNVVFKTAVNMFFISMIAMEVAMNITDALATGGAKLTLWVIPLMLLVRF